MGNEYILEIEGIRKQFPGVLALDDVSLKVRPGKVHALMGENGAGKSTLMKCLFGMYHPDAGRIIFEGKEHHFQNAKHALDTGISMIHQELSNVPKRTVSQNMWLGREPLTKIGLINHRKMQLDTAALMKDLDLDVSPASLMETLSISKQQSCEIAKAVSYNARVVVMDEPTSSLTEKETEHLFRIINDLRSRGGRDHIHIAQDERDFQDCRRGVRDARRQDGRVVHCERTERKFADQSDGRPRYDSAVPDRRGEARRYSIEREGPDVELTEIIQGCEF